jgi:hypothetical protein
MLAGAEQRATAFVNGTMPVFHGGRRGPAVHDSGARPGADADNTDTTA